MNKSGIFSILMPLLMLAAAGVGCAPPKSQVKKVSTVTTCELPNDQKYSLASRWRVQPIPVAFYNGHFDASEMADINSAADTWNEFSNKVWGFSILDLGGGRTVSTSKPSNSSLCAGGLISGGKFIGSVNIYKESPWQSTNHSAIALTTFCTANDQGSTLPSTTSAKRSYMAVMEVNYQDFFVEGKKLPDLKSIFIHEFGHLIGLAHSCEGGGSAISPNCNSSPDSYLEAVMFPVVFFDSLGNGEQRFDLISNDQGRANCLYGPEAYP